MTMIAASANASVAEEFLFKKGRINHLRIIAADRARFNCETRESYRDSRLSVRFSAVAT